jgi:hypothetical protein
MWRLPVATRYRHYSRRRPPGVFVDCMHAARANGGEGQEVEWAGLKW